MKTIPIGTTAVLHHGCTALRPDIEVGMITAPQSVFAAIASAAGAVNADGFLCGSTFFNVLSLVGASF